MRQLRATDAQVAYKGIIELLNNKVIELDHPNAKEALNWATARLGGNEQGIQEIKTRLGPAEEKALSPSKGDDDLPEFKDGVALASYAVKHGWKLADMKMALAEAGIPFENPKEITDIPKALAILFPDKIKESG